MSSKLCFNLNMRVTTNKSTKTRISLFTRFARETSSLAGRPYAFFTAVGVVLLWAVTGPIFNFSDTWQLVINTGTTIVTFLMVFLIQNTQNRDTEALQLKLDELIRSIRGARNEVINLEDMDEKDLERVRDEYLALAEKAHHMQHQRYGKLPTERRRHK